MIEKLLGVVAIMIQPVAIATVTAIITNKLVYRNETRKYLYNKREVLYGELCIDVDALIENHQLLYEKNFDKKMREYKASIKLFGSAKVVIQYRKLLQLTHSYISELEQQDFGLGIPPYEEHHNFHIDEDGEEIFHGSIQTIEEYEKLRMIKQREFKESKIQVERQNITDIIDQLVQAMRKDLGSLTLREKYKYKK